MRAPDRLSSRRQLPASAYLVHHDADVYPDPYAFRPERFLEQPPGTCTWIPFGGGRRRCIGASFALLEMRVAIAAVLDRFELVALDAPEKTRRRSITISPTKGATVTLRARSDAPRPRRVVGEPAASGKLASLNV